LGADLQAAAAAYAATMAQVGAFRCDANGLNGAVANAGITAAAALRIGLDMTHGRFRSIRREWCSGERNAKNGQSVPFLPQVSQTIFAKAATGEAEANIGDWQMA
jgi:hypothetical protein